MAANVLPDVISSVGRLVAAAEAMGVGGSCREIANARTRIKYSRISIPWEEHNLNETVAAATASAPSRIRLQISTNGAVGYRKIYVEIRGGMTCVIRLYNEKELCKEQEEGDVRFKPQRL